MDKEYDVKIQTIIRTSDRNIVNFLMEQKRRRKLYLYLSDLVKKDFEQANDKGSSFNAQRLKEVEQESEELKRNLKFAVEQIDSLSAQLERVLKLSNISKKDLDSMGHEEHSKPVEMLAAQTKDVENRFIEKEDKSKLEAMCNICDDI